MRLEFLKAEEKNLKIQERGKNKWIKVPEERGQDEVKNTEGLVSLDEES